MGPVGQGCINCDMRWHSGFRAPLQGWAISPALGLSLCDVISRLSSGDSLVSAKSPSPGPGLDFLCIGWLPLVFWPGVEESCADHGFGPPKTRR